MRILLDPVTVAILVDRLDNPELTELLAVGKAAGDDQVEVCASISEWLLKRFPHIGASVRRAAAADMN